MLTLYTLYDVKVKQRREAACRSIVLQYNDKFTMLAGQNLLPTTTIQAETILAML